MSRRCSKLSSKHSPLFLSLFAAFGPLAHAQEAASSNTAPAATLKAVVVNASADASSEGLQPAYAGGQVARGGRVGILGAKDAMDTPFSLTAYTNELIQDRQAKSVGEVLQNDPGVRLARGYGNFQESYFIRGFVLGSDDVAYNGLYSLLPRQYIAAELFERVEVLRGASAFLNGATPGNGGIGGAINLLPKRAPNEPLSRVTSSVSSGGQTTVSTDLARRFGADDQFGLRLNAAHRDGDSAVKGESSDLDVGSVGFDWRQKRARVSADIGWQDNKLKSPRPSVTLGSAVSSVPSAPDNKTNYAQPWSYSNERDLFGTLRAEYDVADNLTAWAAWGMRRSDEANSLANVTVTSNSGAATTYRFDNAREDSVNTGEAGLRGHFATGPVKHEWIAAVSYFNQQTKNAYVMDYYNTLATNIYSPVSWSQPSYLSNAFTGNVLSSPALNGQTRLSSVAVGDTLAMLDDRLRVTLGARNQHIQAKSWAYGTHTASIGYDDSRISPVAGVVFKLTQGVSLYGNYIEGLVQGDTAPTSSGGLAVKNAGEILSPYVSRQKEIGAKFDTGRLGFSAAVFTTSRPRAMLTGDGYYEAVGRDRHRGLELNSWGEVIHGLRLLGGTTILDAKQKETGSATTDGKRVIGVPKFQATLGAEWDVPGLRGVALDARVVHTGASYANAANTLQVDGWTRLDVGARYLTEVYGKLTTLRLRVDNVTDKSYWASVGGYPGYGYLVAGAPRTVTLSASVDF